VRALGRSDEKCAAVRDLGAHAVTNVGDVGDGADVVIVCVFSDDQVQQVCLQTELVSAMTPGAVVVIHTTGNPQTAEIIAAQSPGIHVIDAPVSGGPHNIAGGAVTLFVGGSDDAVAKAQPVLASYGDPILHVGPIGAGQRVKLINNTLFAAQIGLLKEAVALGNRLGVDEAKLLASIPHGSGASRVSEFIAARTSVAAFVEGVGEFIGKDVAVARKIVAELGGDLGLLDDVIATGFRA
jgi:3-hydroxyisobutyrate dehydrogenase